MAQQTEAREFDPKPYYLAVTVLVVLEFVRRAFLGYVPSDFTAYLSAADTFADGRLPYGPDAANTPRYAGMPYNYLPGTLWLIWPLHLLDTAAAVALDWVARCTALFVALRIFWRRLLPERAFAIVLMVALFFQPLSVDLLFGNVTTYMLCAFAVCVELAHRPSSVRHTLVAALAGIVLAFKPFWVFSGLFVFAARRHWTNLAATAAGAGAILLLSVPFADQLDLYREHLAAMVAFYHSVALGTFAPWAVPLVFVAWAAAGIALVRRGATEDRWVWACCALVAWPRLGTYSYVMMLPVVLFLVSRFGWIRGLLPAVVFVGPLPWILRTVPVEPIFVVEAAVHWAWAWLVSPIVFWLLWKGPSVDRR